jgi:hypothetical protein
MTWARFQVEKLIFVFATAGAHLASDSLGNVAYFRNKNRLQSELRIHLHPV